MGHRWGEDRKRQRLEEVSHLLARIFCVVHSDLGRFFGRLTHVFGCVRGGAICQFEGLFRAIGQS